MVGGRCPGGTCGIIGTCQVPMFRRAVPHLMRGYSPREGYGWTHMVEGCPLLPPDPTPTLHWLSCNGFFCAFFAQKGLRGVGVTPPPYGPYRPKKVDNFGARDRNRKSGHQNHAILRFGGLQNRLLGDHLLGHNWL